MLKSKAGSVGGQQLAAAEAGHVGVGEGLVVAVARTARAGASRPGNGS